MVHCILFVADQSLLLISPVTERVGDGIMPSITAITATLSLLTFTLFLKAHYQLQRPKYFFSTVIHFWYATVRSVYFHDTVACLVSASFHCCITCWFSMFWHCRTEMNDYFHGRCECGISKNMNYWWWQKKSDKCTLDKMPTKNKFSV